MRKRIFVTIGKIHATREKVLTTKLKKIIAVKEKLKTVAIPEINTLLAYVNMLYFVSAYVFYEFAYILEVV